MCAQTLQLRQIRATVGGGRPEFSRNHRFQFGRHWSTSAQYRSNIGHIWSIMGNIWATLDKFGSHIEPNLVDSGPVGVGMVSTWLTCAFELWAYCSQLHFTCEHYAHNCLSILSILLITKTLLWALCSQLFSSYRHPVHSCASSCEHIAHNHFEL